jgi:hypothetical protein
MKEKIEEIIDKKFETCWVDKRSAIAHFHKDRIEELKSELNTEVQKAVEEAVRGFAEYVEDVKNKGRVSSWVEEYFYLKENKE